MMMLMMMAVPEPIPTRRRVLGGGAAVPAVGVRRPAVVDLLGVEAAARRVRRSFVGQRPPLPLRQRPRSSREGMVLVGVVSRRRPAERGSGARSSAAVSVVPRPSLIGELPLHLGAPARSGRETRRRRPEPPVRLLRDRRVDSGELHRHLLLRRRRLPLLRELSFFVLQLTFLLLGIDGDSRGLVFVFLFFCNFQSRSNNQWPPKNPKSVKEN